MAKKLIKPRPNIARNKIRRIKKELTKATGKAIQMLENRLEFWRKQL